MDKKQLEILFDTWAERKFNKVEKVVNKAKKQAQKTNN
jgi:hypothetical protein